MSLFNSNAAFFIFQKIFGTRVSAMELLEPFGTIWNPLEQSGTRVSALGTVLPSRGVRGVLERALAHYRLPDAIHDISHIIIRHIRTSWQAEADLEDGL